MKKYSPHRRNRGGGGSDSVDPHVELPREREERLRVPRVDAAGEGDQLRVEGAAASPRVDLQQDLAAAPAANHQLQPKRDDVSSHLTRFSS